MQDYKSMVGQTVSYTLSNLSVNRGVLNSVQEDSVQIDGTIYPSETIIFLRKPPTEQEVKKFMDKSLGGYYMNYNEPNKQKTIKERYKGRTVAIVMKDNPERLEGILVDSPLPGEQYLALRRNVKGRLILSILDMDEIDMFKVLK